MLKQIIEIIMKYRGFFSLDQVVSGSGWDRAEVKHRLDRLEAEGLIKRQRETPGRNIKRPGGPVPKDLLYIKRKGLVLRLAKMTATQRKDTGWDKIWRAIRAMRRFTIADLVQLTDCKEDSCRDFIGLLKREKFVRAVNEKSKPITWVMCKDPGPQRPRMKTFGAQSSKLKGEENEVD